MTEIEAIEYLSNKYLVIGSPVNPPEEECEKHNAVIDMAIAALQKQVAKKVKNPYKTRYMWEGGYCPACDCGITSRWGYCQECGQRIDWSGENEHDK